ncbi:defensin alpha 5-like [Ictidomys tridecemlineatus]
MQPTPRSTHTQAPASSPPVTPAMRTLALLAALLLLALQAQAEPLPENNEEAPEQEQPGEEDQDMAISFAGAADSAPQEAGLRRNLICRCKRGSCNSLEQLHGSCLRAGKRFRLCCR